MVSIQWGAWSGVGMVASSAAVLARMQRSGIKAVTPAAGLQALQAILPAALGTVSPCHALIAALRDTVRTLKLIQHKLFDQCYHSHQPARMQRCTLYGCRLRQSPFVGRSSLPRHRVGHSCTATLQQGPQLLCSCQAKFLLQIAMPVLMQSSMQQVSLSLSTPTAS